MKSKIAAAALALPFSLALFNPAAADEQWQNGPIQAIWAAEQNGFAVFEVTIHDAKGARTLNLWVNGLTAGDQNRATFGGYWTSLDGTGTACQMAILDGYGNEVWAWGEIELTFDRPGFPSGWQAALGQCFIPAVEFIAVQPATGIAGGPPTIK